jgi:hypothetical protein
MGYKFTNKVRIELGELGDNMGTPFFVEIKNPKLMTWEQKMEMSKFGVAEGEILTPEQTAERGKMMEEYAQKLILGWNLLDMTTEQPITPSSEGALSKVPSEVVEKIFAQFNQEDQETKN